MEVYYHVFLTASLLSFCCRTKRTRKHDDFGFGSVLKMLGSAEHCVTIEDSFIFKIYLSYVEIFVSMCMESVHKKDSTGRSSSYGAKL